MLSGRAYSFRRIAHGTVSGWGVSVEASRLGVVVDGTGVGPGDENGCEPGL